MNTRSWSYLEAGRTTRERVELTQEQAVAYVLHGGNDSQMLHAYCLQVEHAVQQVKGSGKYPYNSDVARAFMTSQGIQDTPEHKERTERLVYGTNKATRARETIELYTRMWNDGFISLHDVTEDMHGKRALLTGKSSIDWLSITKNGEKVKIYCKGNKYGYQKPNMRTRYYIPQIDADYFVKV